MVFPIVLPRLLAKWLLSCYKPTRKLRRQASLHRTNSRILHPNLLPSVTKFPTNPGNHPSESFVCDFQTTLLCSSQYSLFPFFMLVAFEGGSLLRALFLLLSYPLILLIGDNEELSIRIMVFIAFCGARKKEMEIVSRAVLPKFYLENLNKHSYEVLSKMERRVVVTRMPRVMVEWFLKEYLEVGEVLGAELGVKIVGGCSFFTGLVSSGLRVSERSKALKDLFGEKKADVGLVSYCNPLDNLFISYCKEPYIVTKDASGPTSVLPRENYPKPLVFHDGRLAFLPTPTSSLFLFLYFPFGLILATCRILFGILLPYKLALTLGPLSGVILRADNLPHHVRTKKQSGGVLFVCNHRTLLDPVMLTCALAKPLTAVTYSLSPVSELLAPIKTVRLTRNRATDASMIQQLLREGDLVVCPEGTTCRERYLLRFSALFAELAEEMVPVAVNTRVSMFYGTTASGFKMLDPLFFLMNPRPVYELKFLGLVPREFTYAGGMKGVDVANRIQRELGEELGFECTELTRRDKYLVLAGNEGIVNEKQSKKD